MIILGCGEIIALGLCKDSDCCSSCHSEFGTDYEQVFDVSGPGWEACVCCGIINTVNWNEVTGALVDIGNLRKLVVLRKARLADARNRATPYHTSRR
jgi:hypothetical protein